MHALACSLLALLLLTAGASAGTLALPDRLVALSSPQGEDYLLESKEIESYVLVAADGPANH